MIADLIQRETWSSVRRVVAIAGVCLATSINSVIAGQGTSGPPPGQSSDLPRRAAQLQDRHDRFTNAGLVDAAARTAKELEQLARAARNDACSDYWSGRVQPPKFGASDSAKGIERTFEEYQRKMAELAEQCMWRPGQGPTRSADTDSAMRKVVATEGLHRRRPLFVEPALATRADPDVPNAVYGFIDMASLRNDTGSPDPFARTEARSAAVRRITDLNNSVTFGDLAQAKASYERALQGLDGPSGEPATLVALETLRVINERLGDVPEALRNVRSSLAILENRYGTESSRLCHVLWSAVPLFLANGEPDEATDAAMRCLALVESRGPASLTRASALNNLGLVHHRLGSLNQALDAYRRSLAILERAAAPTSSATDVANADLLAMIDKISTTQTDPPLIVVHANLGLVHWQLGDIPKAAQHMRLAREQMRPEGTSLVTERGFVDSMTTLGPELDGVLTLERAVERLLGDSASLALPLLLERKSIGLDAKASVMGTFDDARLLRRYRALLARRSMLARGMPASADERRAWMREAADIDIQILGVEAEARQRSQGLDAVVPYVRADPRGRAYDEALNKATVKHQNQLMKDASGNFESLLAARAEATKRAEAEIAPKFKDYLESRQRRERGEREGLLPRIQTSLSNTAVLLELVRFRPVDVRARTDADRFGPARYGAYIVRSTGAPTFIDIGETAPIDDLVVELRRSLAQPRGTLAHDLGRRLDAVLMQPVRERLGTERLIHVSPDGALNLVPFGALVDEEDRYLIERYTFNYVSSGRDLVRRPSVAAASSGPPVVIADPAFGSLATPDAPSQTAPDPAVVSRGSVSSHFEPLPGTAAEAAAIREIFADASIYTGATATETLMKAMSAPRILHVATHGFFLADEDLSAATADAEDPMLRSGLVFASVNTRQSGLDDGILTALEAASLELAGTRLVVLSACETGVGDVKTGEGVFGLRRAFIAAGAETLVMSLWQVEDTATQLLMVEFYRRLVTGEARAEALRQASLTLLRNPSYRHPFYWASFISSGAAGSMGR